MSLAFNSMVTKHGRGEKITYVDKCFIRSRSAGEHDSGFRSGPLRVSTSLEKDPDNSAITAAFWPAFCSAKTDDD